MALINYVEPVNPGSIFAGLGAFIVMVTLAYLFYRFGIKIIQYFEVIYNNGAKHMILEEVFLDKIASKKGIDLNKELVKRKMYDGTQRKSFRRRVEDQIFEDMFGKDKEV